MSLLAPLYALGLAAISLPILFHLIRRTPKGVQPFSSLMFIVPTPPRLTRRSRIDQLLLLLLRAAILGLLAFAFARPFFRLAATARMTDLSGQFVAVLIDTSGSMRRGDVWQRVEGELDRVLHDLGPKDAIALYQFDHQTEPLASFAETESLTFQSRKDLIRKRFLQMRPTWSESQLGNALIRVADDLDATDDQKETTPAKQLILISDLQEGSQIESLQGYQWPAAVQLVVRRVSAHGTTNASLQLLDQQEEWEDERGVRVRVSNAADSQSQHFAVRWQGAEPEPTAQPVTVSVPPGESRVVRIPRAAPGHKATQLVLTGDDHDFDNHYFVAALTKSEGTIVYVGSEPADDPEHMRYYLERALTNDRWQQVKLVPVTSGQLGDLQRDKPWLIVISDKLDAASCERVHQYVTDGGIGLAILTDSLDATTLSTLSGTEVGAIDLIKLDDYVMWSKIDFSDPLFRPFANPRYNDFSSIHFWKYRRVAIPDEGPWKKLVQYDNGDTALASCRIGTGTLYLLTATWEPSGSQLARSSKFVPLLNGILRRDISALGRSYLVNEPIRLPSGGPSETITVTRPDGSVATISDNQAAYEETDQPGLYKIGAGDQSRLCGVNLATAETKTAPLDVAQLEQRGVRLGDAESAVEKLATLPPDARRRAGSEAECVAMDPGYRAHARNRRDGDRRPVGVAAGTKRSTGVDA